MELLIVLLVIFVIWTNEALFGKSVITEVPKKTPEEEFAAALVKFLDKGSIPVRCVNKDDKKGGG